MKKIVVWLSASSRVSWLQVWKTDACVAFVAYFDMLMVRSNLSARSRKEGTQGAVAILRGKKVHGCVSQNSDPMNSVLRKAVEFGLNASAGHTMKFWRCTWYKITIRESKRTIWRHYPKRWTSWAKSLRAQFWEEILEETSRQADCDSKSSVELGKKVQCGARAI